MAESIKLQGLFHLFQLSGKMVMKQSAAKHTAQILNESVNITPTKSVCLKMCDNLIFFNIKETEKENNSYYTQTSEREDAARKVRID